MTRLGKSAAQVGGRIGVVVELELDVGLVEDHGHVVGHALAEARRSAAPGRWVAVGLFGLQTITSWVAAVTSVEHRLEVVHVAVVERRPGSRARPRAAPRYGYIENEGQA